jgi:TPR repeat protein
MMAVDRDQAEAAKWYRKAAEHGLAEAQFRLSLCYDLDSGVVEDKAEAVEWYMKAAEHGLADAMVWLKTK